MRPVHLLGLILIAISASCSKNDSDPDVAITGEWKLEKVFTMYEIYDYSDNNVIYRFQPDGTLIISSDLNEQSQLYPEGSYPYEFDLTGLFDNNKYTFNGTLKIGGTGWGCSVSAGRINCGNTVYDGPLFQLIKR